MWQADPHPGIAVPHRGLPGVVHLQNGAGWETARRLESDSLCWASGGESWARESRRQIVVAPGSEPCWATATGPAQARARPRLACCPIAMHSASAGCHSVTVDQEVTVGHWASGGR